METAEAFERAQVMYAPKIRTFAEKTWRFLPGYDRADLEQEMVEVLWRCVLAYDPNRGARFSTLFWRSARRQLITIRRYVGAQKRKCEAYEVMDGDVLAQEIDSVLREFSAEDYAIGFLAVEERIL